MMTSTGRSSIASIRAESRAGTVAAERGDEQSLEQVVQHRAARGWLAGSLASVNGAVVTMYLFA
jgi:hypothetical protein